MNKLFSVISDMDDMINLFTDLQNEEIILSTIENVEDSLELEQLENKNMEHKDDDKPMIVAMEEFLNGDLDWRHTASDSDED